MIFRPLTDLCVIPSTLERREREKHGEVVSQEDLLASEEYRIVLAKLILRLLPKAHFGSLTYILAFLAQLPHCSAANLTVDKLSIMFGPIVCAPRDPLAYLEAEQTFPDNEDFKMDIHVLADASTKYITGLSEDTLHWLLTHWDHLAQGLLDGDHTRDIANFQEMVAYTVDTDRVEDGELKGSVSFINTLSSQKMEPSIPYRLYEDDANNLLEESETSSNSGRLDEEDLLSQQASRIAQLEAEVTAARRLSEHNAAQAGVLRDQISRLMSE